MKTLVLFVGAAMLATAPAIAQKPAGSAAPEPAPNEIVDVDFMIGRWSDQPNCTGTLIDIRRDGSFVNLDGTGGSWRLEGDTVTLTGTRTLSVRVIPRNHLELTVINPDGSEGYSRRCIALNQPQTR